MSYAYDSLRSVAADSFPVFLKYAMNIRNELGGDPRKPILPLFQADQEVVKSLLEELHVLERP
jgi:dihydrodipicolinate synthase/N-acetylneuraminate lyase